ncbi:MAG: YeeE/YedE thiosulfate transporter family protein [Clostridiaceae bacterium]
MTSEKIEELKARRQRRIVKKKNQLPYGIIFTIIGIIIYVIIAKFNFQYSMFWAIGVLIGFVLQRSRFCFTAGFRDPIVVGSTSVLRAIIIGLIICTIGFALIQFNYLQHNPTAKISDIPGSIHPVGMHTVIGAFIFGIGMVIAGGCASGMLMRIGEGFLLQIIVLIGFMIGALLSANKFKFWHNKFISKSPIIYLPKYLNLDIRIVALAQIVILIILYLIAYIYDKRKSIMKNQDEIQEETNERD